MGNMNALRAPKTMYVPQDICSKDGPVTITTTKLNIQFDAVLSAFAGALIRRPTISAGWSIWERERSKGVSLVQFKLRKGNNGGGRGIGELW